MSSQILRSFPLCKMELGPPQATRRDIDKLIDRLLKDIGILGPPLDLDAARSLLKLDRGYYSSTDSGRLDGVLHKLRIAGHNILHEPRRLLDVVRKLSLKALVIPERKQLLIDSELPSPKQRWAESHEIVHLILPWHADYAHGDRERTLTEACHAEVESEANYGAGRLLFLGGRFRDEVLASPITLDRVHSLSKLYGNSFASTLWRTTEHAGMPVLGLLSMHPWDIAEPGVPRIRRMFCSPAYAAAFSGVDPEMVLRKLAKVVKRRGGGPLGSDHVRLVDDRGAEHEFVAECFNNTHDVLSLIVHARALPTVG